MHIGDKIQPVRDSPPRQYASHPPLVRTRGGCPTSGGGGVRTGTVLVCSLISDLSFYSNYARSH